MIRSDFSERDIHLALDGELPADERQAYEAWLGANPELQAKQRRYAADRNALRDAYARVLDEPVPARFNHIVLGDMPRPASAFPRSPRWLAAAAALLLAVGGIGGYAAGMRLGVSEETAEDRLAETAIAAHAVYAAEKEHAVEVSAGRKEHLQSWLSARVGLRLVAPDLSDEGFEFVGGRLLPSGEGKAAMFLYENDAGRRVSVFVTAEAPGTSKGTYKEAEDGPRAVYWLDKGYGCAVVGELPQAQLSTVAKSAYQQLMMGLAG